MSVTQTVDIPDSRRLTIEVPDDVPSGKTLLTYTAFSTVSANKDLERAEKVWAYNHTHSDELREQLQKLHGRLGDKSFDGLDGIAYQRKVRDDWNI